MDGDIFTTTAANNAVRRERLQKILKRYELTATSSLGGPAATMMIINENQTIDDQPTVNEKPEDRKPPAPSTTLSNALDMSTMQRDTTVSWDEDALKKMDQTCRSNDLLRNAIPLQPFPILLQNDRTSAGANEKQETVLEGEYIACFSVGGEKRLCLPQVLNTVLKDCTLVDINKARNELNIHCSYCTMEQLHILKLSGVLSFTANSCSLITKTDAERLCNYLLRQSGKAATGRSKERRKSNGLASDEHMETAQSSGSLNDAVIVPVMHMCFGRCRGRYHPRLYASPSAECIECEECGEMFAPDRFVMHSHRNQERRICHWGFDSANWRAYIHLPGNEKQENGKILDQMKLRFDVTGLTKRRFDEHSADKEDASDRQARKRLKTEDEDMTASMKGKKHILMKPTLLKDQSPWLYFLYDPISLATYCQSLLSTAAAGGMIRPQQQQQQQQQPSPASFLTSMHLTNGLINAKLAADAIAPTEYATLHSAHQQLLQQGQGQLRDVNTTKTDEATAVEALKLLRSRASIDSDNECARNKSIHYNDQRTPDNEEMNCPVPTEADTKSMPERRSFHAASKESYKKHLLHLFSAEQQQKQQQQYLDLQQQQKSPTENVGRESVEVIVDAADDCKRQKKPLVVTKSLQTTPTFDDGRVRSEETVPADESSASDSEGADQSSLDDLLKRFIEDKEALRNIRSKITVNQQYLQQKLESVLSENRLLRAECMQLRYQFHEQQLVQQKHPNQLLSSSLLGR